MHSRIFLINWLVVELELIPQFRCFIGISDLKQLQISWKSSQTDLIGMGIIVIISLKLKFSKSQKQFIETPLPKHQTKYLTKFCPMKLGQNLVKYKKNSGNGVSGKNAFEIYWPLLTLLMLVNMQYVCNCMS